MAAGHAGVLAEVAARADERHPVSEQHARHRMTDERSAVGLMDEAVTAVAGVLDAAVALRHSMHVVSEQSAEIPDAFLEPIPGAIGIRVQRK